MLYLSYITAMYSLDLELLSLGLLTVCKIIFFFFSAQLLSVADLDFGRPNSEKLISVEM